MDSPTSNPGRDLPKELKEVLVVHITDPMAVGDVIEVYDMDVINLDQEEFEYNQVTVPLKECSLIYQHTSKALRTRSHIYKDFESCFILGPHSRGSIDGTELHPYSMIAAGPGAQAEVVIDGDYENVGWIELPNDKCRDANLCDDSLTNPQCIERVVKTARHLIVAETSLDRGRAKLIPPQAGPGPWRRRTAPRRAVYEPFSGSERLETQYSGRQGPS